LQILLLVLKLGTCLVVPVGDFFKVQARGMSQVMVVTLANIHHRLPVILVEAKDQREDAN
jgi:hypothetical protein